MISYHAGDYEVCPGCSTGTEVNQEIVDFAVGKLQEKNLFCTHRAANFKSQVGDIYL